MTTSYILLMPALLVNAICYTGLLALQSVAEKNTLRPTSNASKFKQRLHHKIIQYQYIGLFKHGLATVTDSHTIYIVNDLLYVSKP